MIKITQSRETKADIGKVWEVLTDESNESATWKEIRSIHVIGRRGNVIEREAVVGPKVFGFKTKQTLTLEPQKSIHLEIVGEKESGHRDITLNLNGRILRLDVIWELELTGVPDFVNKIVQAQITKVTGDALDRIVSQADGR